MERIERRLFLLKAVFTYSEAAIYMGCTEACVRKLTSGKNPAIKSKCPGGKLRYIARTDIEEYLLRGK
jgi:excisionase family DNA binding protein